MIIGTLIWSILDVIKLRKKLKAEIRNVHLERAFHGHDLILFFNKNKVYYIHYGVQLRDL